MLELINHLSCAFETLLKLGSYEASNAMYIFILFCSFALDSSDDALKVIAVVWLARMKNFILADAMRILIIEFHCSCLLLATE